MRRRRRWACLFAVGSVAATATASAQRPVVRDESQVCIDEPKGAGTTSIARGGALDPAALARGTGSLTVVVHLSSVRHGATITLSRDSLSRVAFDGADVADSTPRRWTALAAGPVTVLVRGFGYERLGTTTAIRAGASDTLHVNLRAVAGCHWVDVAPRRPRRPFWAIAVAGFFAVTAFVGLVRAVRSP